MTGPDDAPELKDPLAVSYEAFKMGGYSKSFPEFVTLLETNPKAFGDAYEAFKVGGYSKELPDYEALINPRIEQYRADTEYATLLNSLFEQEPSADVKKKDDGQSGSALVPTSADSSFVPVIGNITSEEDPIVQAPQTWQNDWGWFGETVVGDFIADMGYVAYSGQSAGESGAQALDLLYGGSQTSDEDILEWINQYTYSQSFLPTDEMAEFQADAEEYGGGFWGTLVAGIANPEAGLQMMASSLSQLANSRGGAAGASIIASGAAVGTVLPGAGTLAGAAATLPYAMGAAGALTEAGIVFQEGLAERLDELGQDLNVTNVRNILQDSAFLANLRWEAGLKGGVTGIIDMVGGAGVSKLGGTVIRGGKGFRVANQMVEQGSNIIDAMPSAAISKGRYVAGLATTTGGEMVVGGLSEVGGQLAAYGEVSGSQVAEEIIGSGAKGPITMARATILGAKYTVDGKRVSRSELTDALHGLSIEEIRRKINNKEIVIKRDPALVDFIFGPDQKKKDAAADKWYKNKKKQEALEKKLQEDPDNEKLEKEYADTVAEEQTLWEEYNALREKQEQRAKLKEDTEPDPEPTPEPTPEAPPAPTDPLANEVMAFISEQDEVSIPAIMRKFKLGYNRSNKIMDELVEAGLVSPFDPEKGFVVVPEDQRPTSKPEPAPEPTPEPEPTDPSAPEQRSGQADPTDPDQKPTELQGQLAAAKAKLEEASNAESASAARRTAALEEAGRLEEAQELQERINKLQDKLDGGVTKKGKRFTKKGKEGLQKQIDNRTAELKALYDDVGINEDVANVLASSRERAKAQQEVDRLQAEVDKETAAANQSQTEVELNKKLKRYGLDKDRNKPARQTIVNTTSMDFSNGEQSYYNGFQIGSLVNHPIVLTKFANIPLSEPIRGFLRLRDNGLVEVVSHDGRKHYELGNINEGFDIDALAEGGKHIMAMDNNPYPSITDAGQIVVDGKVYSLATHKQFWGIERYKNNNIKNMVVVDADGKEVVLVENGRTKPSNKPATDFSAQMAAWSEEQQRKKKEGTQAPEILRDENETVEEAPEETPEETPEAAQPPEPPTPPEDTDTTTDPDQQPLDQTTDKDREENLRGEGIYGFTVASRWLPLLDRIRRNTVLARGFFPKSVQALRDFRDGRLNMHARRSERTANQFMKLWKRMSKNMNEDEQAAVMNAMDRLFRGEKVDLTASGIPAEMVIILKRMRNDIDAVTQDMLNRGLIPDKNGIDPDTGEPWGSRQTMEENIGSYVSRTYELFDGKNWAKRVSEETKREGVEYMKENIQADEKVNKRFQKWAAEEKKRNPSISDEALLQEYATKLVNQLLAQDSETVSTYTGSQDAPNRSPLRQRQELDPRLRALLGERTNPMTNYIVTMSRVAQLSEKLRYLHDVREMGLKMGWLFDDAAPAGVEGFDAPVRLEGIPDELNPLAGMVTTPEVAKALRDQPNWFDRNIAGTPLGKVFGIAKWNKTVASATTHARNVIGNVSFVMANGHFDARSAGVSLSEIFVPTDEGYNRLVELGVIGQASNRQEITELMNSGTVLDALEKRFRKNGSPFQNWVNKAWRATGGNLAKAADMAYLAEDDFFKIYGFEIEKARYSKAIYGKAFDALTSEERMQVEERAAAIIKNVYPNYNRVGPLIAGISKMPAIGTFLAFRAESFRTGFNILRLAYAEMQDPRTRSIGAKRLAGIVAYQSTKAGVQASGAAASGYGLLSLLGVGKQEDEEGKHNNDYDDIAYFVRPWEKSGYAYRAMGGTENVISDQLIITDIDREKGIVKYRNMSTVDGFSDPTAVFQRVMAGLQGKGEISDSRLVDAFAGGLIELVGPFVEEEMTMAVLNQVTNNAKPSGAMIYNPDDPWDKKSMDIMSYMWKVFGPSAISQGKKLATGGYGDTPMEAFLGIIGLGEIEVNLKDQMELGVIPDFRERFNRNKNLRYKAEEYQGGETVDDYMAMVDEKTKRDIEAMKELSDYCTAAMNLGAKYEDLETMIKTKLRLGKVLIPFEEGSMEMDATELILLGDKEMMESIMPNYDKDLKYEIPE